MLELSTDRKRIDYSDNRVESDNITTPKRQ